MVDLTDDEKRIVETMKVLRAVAENQLKDADQIAKASMMPKGKVSNLLISLSNKKVVKRVVREKAAGYYLISGVV